jgi:FkbM family methyltransferase
MLEKDFGWSGILVEPGRNWHDKIVQNRSCKIDFRCVSSSSHQELDFLETSSPELSTLSSFENSDENLREINATYKVKSVSLIDLLNQYNSPNIIDYLSIDTEGSEYMILKDFDFSQYRFRIISCEHNYSTNREKIFKLFTKNGYERIWDEFTQFDDWYVNPELI